MYRPEITFVTQAGDADVNIKDAGTKGWFIMVPAAHPSTNGTITMEGTVDDDNSDGVVLFFQRCTAVSGIYSPSMAKPLKYNNGLYCTLTGTGNKVAVYTWPRDMD